MGTEHFWFIAGAGKAEVRAAKVRSSPERSDTEWGVSLLRMLSSFL